MKILKVKAWKKEGEIPIISPSNVIKLNLNPGDFVLLKVNVD
jgi:hypothetical protein